MLNPTLLSPINPHRSSVSVLLSERDSSVLSAKSFGKMVVHVSELGPSCCEIPAHDDEHNIGNISKKKHLHPRTEERTFLSNGGDNDEVERKKKKVKKEYSETEADSSSSSCFVALVTDSNLHNDALELPKDFTTSNGFKRECSEIVLTDKGERAWSLDLSFNESSETFYVSRGWRCFCHENSKKAGGFFKFNMVGNGEIPVFSFCPKESRQRECSEASWRESLSTQLSSSEEECSSMGLEKRKKDGLRCRDSTSPSQNRFVTLTPTHASLDKSRQHLPSSFVIENGMTRPGMITLLGKDGTEWLAKLIRNGKGRMRLGKGWTDFAKGNGLKIGKSYTLESIWENATPMLRLLNTESTRLQGECSNEPSSGNKIRKAKNNSEERRDDSSSFSSNGGDNSDLARKKKKVKMNNSETEADSSSCFVALVTTSNLQKDALELPKDFTTTNGFKRECSEIVLTDKGERAWSLDLSFNESSETFYVSRGWRCFCNENSKKAGGFFILNLVGNGEIPVLSFCPKESRQRECSEASRKDRRRCRDSTSPRQNRFVTLTPTHASLRKGRQHLPFSFMIGNGITRPGMMVLLGKDGTKWLVKLVRNGERMMSLGSGWKDFAIANGLKIGEAFTLELIRENGTPMLRLLSTESTRQQGECSKEPNSEEMKQNRFVTLTLTPQDVRECKLDLPIRFMRANGINELGKITLLGEKETKWFGYLLRKDGTVAMGSGWKSFCEANGVKIGKSFTLEFISKQDKNCVFNFSSNS